MKVSKMTIKMIETVKTVPREKTTVIMMTMMISMMMTMINVNDYEGENHDAGNIYDSNEKISTIMTININYLDIGLWWLA